MEQYSPRVRNLQTEMDLLRTEIQRLKAIDIYADPTKMNCQQQSVCQDHRTLLHSKKQMAHFSREQVQKKLMQLGLASHKHLSDSDTSDGEDLEGGHSGDLGRESRTEMPEKALRHSEHLTLMAARNSTTEGSESDEWSTSNGLYISTGTDPIAMDCLECDVFHEEKRQLLQRMQHMEEVLHQESERAMQAEKKAQRSVFTPRSLSRPWTQSLLCA